MSADYSRSHDQFNEALAEARGAFAADKPRAGEALGRARRLYTEGWSAAAAVCPDVGETVGSSLQRMCEALERGDAAEFGLQRQIASKSLLTIAYRNMDIALAKDDLAAAQSWWPLFVAKFKWDQRPVPAVQAMAEAARDGRNLGPAREAVKSALIDAFSLKVKEEGMEAVAYGSTDRAVGREKAIEAVVYFGAVDADLATRLGAARHRERASAVNGLYAAASEGDPEQVKALANRIKGILG